MKAMILAAGEGHRMRPLTDHLPKPMLPVGGRPLIERSIDLLRTHGVDEVAINLHHLPEKITAHLGDGACFGVRIVYSMEDVALGTAGGVKRMQAFFDDGPFFVLYGDVLTDMDLSSLRSLHIDRRAALTMALHQPDTFRGCGVATLGPDHRVLDFVEKPAHDAGQVGWANAGVYVVEPDILRYVPNERPFDFARDLFPLLLQRSVSLFGFTSDALVLDIGTPGGYARAQSVATARDRLKAS